MQISLLTIVIFLVKKITFLAFFLLNICMIANNFEGIFFRQSFLRNRRERQKWSNGRKSPQRGG